MLQEEQEQEAEDADDDADLNAEANKIYKDNNDMVISMGEGQKTLECRETMNVEVENIGKKNRDQYMKLLILHFLEQQNISDKNIQNELQFLTSKVEVYLKNGYGTRVV